MFASLMLTFTTFAQVGARNTALFQFRNGEEPKDVTRLGTAPEFPFLMNKASASQVHAAIQRHADDHAELDALLMQIGYANGAQDLEASDVTETRLQAGTVGNMGSAGYTYGLYRLQLEGNELKAWKIAANDGKADGALYILARCGNAFYPRKDAPRTAACLNVPVEIRPDMSEISLPASGSKITTENKTFVYYNRKRHKKDDQAYPVAGLNAQYPSDPLPVNQKTDIQIKPETYTVSLNRTRSEVTACVNKTVLLTGDVNVEKTSTYTGNFPKGDNATYLEVSKRDYKMIDRKKRHAERKANRIAKKTGQPVVVKKES